MQFLSAAAWTLEGLDRLETELKKLAASGRRGRALDCVAKVFFEGSYKFVPFHYSTSGQRRVLKPEQERLD